MKQQLKYRREFYNRPITSMLLIANMFAEEKFGVYSAYKKILKERIKDTDLENYLVQYLAPYVKDKLPEYSEIVVVDTLVGPVFRVAVNGHVLPLMEDGFETAFIRHGNVRPVIGGKKSEVVQ